MEKSTTIPDFKHKSKRELFITLKMDPILNIFQDPNALTLNTYLFGVLVRRRNVAVPLTVDGRVGTPADGVHLPQREIVVHHVYIPASAPGHTLHQRLPKMVERDRHLHAGVRQVLVVVAEQHHLVMVREVVVGDGDSGGPHYGVDEAVRAVGQGAVVDPDLPRAVDGDPVAVGSPAPADVGGAGGNVGVAGGLAVVDVDVVDDDVGDVLEGDAAVADDVDVGAAAVDGLEAVHDKLVLELDGRVGGEDDP